MTRWLILLALGFGQVTAQSAPPARSPAEDTFARIKDMAGTWTANSTKGWDEDLRFQVLAGGSAVLETSFDAHPGETMATLFYMNGPRLMLTHYVPRRDEPAESRRRPHGQGRLPFQRQRPHDLAVDVVSGSPGTVDGKDPGDAETGPEPVSSRGTHDDRHDVSASEVRRADRY